MRMTTRLMMMMMMMMSDGESKKKRCVRGIARDEERRYRGWVLIV